MTASGDYTPVSSDIYVYDRETLEELAYVAYDSAESVNARASIWCIDETGTVPATKRTIASSDIEGFDVDIESPMPDTIGGFYICSRVERPQREYFIWKLDDGTYSNQASMLLYEEGVEIENPPLDGNNGFYFANVDLMSPDANTLISTMTLMHGRTTGATSVYKLGEFLAPPSTFLPNPKDPQAIPAEQFQNEFALVEVPDHNQLFVGAGPVGGKFTLTVFDWTQKAVLESGDNVIRIYTDEDMGGNANIGGMVQFTESSGSGGVGSKGECDSGFGIVAIAGLAAVTREPTATSRYRNCRPAFRNTESCFLFWVKAKGNFFSHIPKTFCASVIFSRIFTPKGHLFSHAPHFTHSPA